MLQTEGHEGQKRPESLKEISERKLHTLVGQFLVYFHWPDMYIY